MTDIRKSVIDKQTVELSLPSVMGYERLAMVCSESIAKRVGFKHERIEDLKTVVAEACINAIQHGNKDFPEARVLVRMKYIDETFQVDVADKGPGFDSDLKDPDIEKIIDGLEPNTGFGLFLIKNLVDRVQYNIITGYGHTIRLFVRRNPIMDSDRDRTKR